jgi:hypothetical protein
VVGRAAHLVRVVRWRKHYIPFTLSTPRARSFEIQLPSLEVQQDSRQHACLSTYLGSSMRSHVRDRRSGRHIAAGCPIKLKACIPDSARLKPWKRRDNFIYLAQLGRPQPNSRLLMGLLMR